MTKQLTGPGPERNIEDLLEQIEDMKLKERALKDSLREAEAERDRIQASVASIMKSHAIVRQILGPLFNSLKQLYGELQGEDVVTEARTSSAANPVTSGKWETIRARVGGRQAEVIGLLQQVGEMTAAQIAASLKCDVRTVRDMIYKLKQGGFINKNGGKFSLKD